MLKRRRKQSMTVTGCFDLEGLCLGELSSRKQSMIIAGRFSCEGLYELYTVCVQLIKALTMEGDVLMVVKRARIVVLNCILCQ